MKKVVTVVGARPQFIKAAMISHAIKGKYEQILVHTGQHYDPNMSDVFFEELDIPKPKYNLGISGGGHGSMTGRMMIEIEKVLLEEKPDMVLVYGDTNSTLAAALCSVKYHIPLCHVESGGRMGTLSNPEEVNRICTDHVSSLLVCCAEQIPLSNLKHEGLEDKAVFLGDPMYDAFCCYTKKTDRDTLNGIQSIYGETITIPEKYYYMTCHRQENTDETWKLEEILNGMDSCGITTIYPVHPRNREMVKQVCEENKFENIRLVNPVGYLESIALVNHAKKIVTDSGGLQREAFFAGIPCVTLFDIVIWPETMVEGRNVLASLDRDDIRKKVLSSDGLIYDKEYQPFGDGHSAEKIVDHICEYMKAQ